MKFSADKCIFLTYKCQVPPGSLCIGGSPIDSQPFVRDLGLSCSCSFNFSEHADLQTAKAKKCLGLLFRSFQLRQSILYMYKVHARPLLEYCPLIFTSMRKSDRIIIECIQRRFTKQLIGWSSNLNYRERCLSLKIEPLWLRRIKLNLIFLYKLLTKQSYSSSQLCFSPDTGYSLRNRQYTITTPSARTVLRFKFFLFAYSRIWNKLPLHIRSSRSKYAFVHAIDKFLSVPTVLRLFNVHVTESQAYEIGLDF